MPPCLGLVIPEALLPVIPCLLRCRIEPAEAPLTSDLRDTYSDEVRSQGLASSLSRRNRHGNRSAAEELVRAGHSEPFCGSRRSPREKNRIQFIHLAGFEPGLPEGPLCIYSCFQSGLEAKDNVCTNSCVVPAGSLISVLNERANLMSAHAFMVS